MLLALLAAAAPAPPAPARGPASDPDLALGIRQVEEGRFEDAAFTLDPLVRRLADRRESAPELAQAHVYLGLACAGLGRTDRARQEFLQALRIDKAATLPAELARPAARAAFDAARQEVGRKGSKKALLIGAAGGAAAVAVAVAAGGGAPAPAPTPSAAPPTPTAASPPPPARPGQLTASVTSMQARRTLNCQEDVVGRVTLTNQAASPVTVNGVRRTTNVTFGGCNAAPDFTYVPLVRTVAGGQTAVVFDGPLYPHGSGCCYRGRLCDGSNTCGIEETLSVLTSIGDIPAGSFGYRVNFVNCVTCTSFGATSCDSPAPHE